MFIRKPYLILGIGVGVGVFSCAIHLLSRKNKDQILRTTRNRVTRTIKIPKGFVGHILGRGGCNIKAIREKTKARIVFDDQGSDFTLATVSGTPEEVEEAVNEINQILSNRSASVTKELTVSESLFNSSNLIRQICDLTRAKITLEFLPSKKENNALKLFLKGKKEEVDAASNMIDEFIAESQVATETKTTVHVAGRALPNSLPLHSFTVKSKSLPCEQLIPSNPDGFIEIYVSAVENPKKFWAQISGTKSIQLDKLATEMTEFYDDEKNKKLVPSNVAVGDIVAAYFQGDTSWYRSQVTKISDTDQGKSLTVFYVDFGDSAILRLDDIKILKPEFLSIPFQAIECSLPDIEPVGAEWTEEAIDEFEKLVYLAKWKVIMAKPLKQEPKCEGASTCTVQFVKLIDTHTEKNIDISAELVAKGFAKTLSS